MRPVICVSRVSQGPHQRPQDHTLRTAVLQQGVGPCIYNVLHKLVSSSSSFRETQSSQ